MYHDVFRGSRRDHLPLLNDELGAVWYLWKRLISSSGREILDIGMSFPAHRMSKSLPVSLSIA